MNWKVEVIASPNATGWSCTVRVGEGSRIVSEHEVDVTRSDLERLAPSSSVEDLVKRSFEFLLEREPPQSILRRFALPDIERYFPEFSRVITS